MIYEYSAKVEQGKLKFADRAGFVLALSSLEGKDIKVILKKKHRTRSLNQNNYLWGVVYDIISKELGYTPQELHDVFKAMFLSEERSFRGKLIVVPRTTTTLSTSEMMNYIDNIVRYAAQELKIFIPEPNGEVYE